MIITIILLLLMEVLHSEHLGARTISFHGVNVFINNTAIDGNGGTLLFSGSSVTFHGETAGAAPEILLTSY